MSDIKFECPNCGQHIAAEENDSGMIAQCPTCSCSLIIPHVSYAANVNFDEVIMHVKIDSWDSILTQLKLIQSRNIKKLTIINEMNDSLSLERNEYYIATFDDNRNILTTLSTALTFKKVIEIFEEFYKTQTINRKKVRWKNPSKVAERYDDSLHRYEQQNISYLYSQSSSPHYSTTPSKRKSSDYEQCWRCDGMGRKYTNGGQGKICHVCKGSGVIHKSSNTQSRDQSSYKKPSSDFDSPIVKGGCFFVLALFLLVFIGSCLNDSNKSNVAEEEIMYPMEGNDPKNWRKHEEQLENRIPSLRNAPYACKRCGMKSDRPLDDPDGIWGRNGVCAYCLAK